MCGAWTGGDKASGCGDEETNNRTIPAGIRKHDSFRLKDCVVLVPPSSFAMQDLQSFRRAGP